MRNVILGLGVALAGLATGVAALAAQSVTPSSAPTAPETILSASTDILFDSNIARSSKELAAARGLTLADELFTPSANFVLARRLGPQILFVSGDLAYDFHRVDTILDREHFDVIAGVNGRLGRCKGVASGAFTRQQSDLSSQSLRIVTNVQDVTTVGLSTDCGRAVGFAPVASITQSWRDNSSQEYISTNVNILTLSAGMAYRELALGSLSINGNYSKADFPRRFDDPFNPTRSFGYGLYSVSVVYARRIGARIEGSAALYYTALEPNSTVSPAFHGLSYSVDATYHASPALALHVAASRATTPSNRINADYSIDDSYQADIAYAVGNRLALALTGSRKTQSYRGVPNAAVADLTQQTTDSVFLSAKYIIDRRFSIMLNVGDEERIANYSGLSYSSTKVGLLLKATY